MLENLVDEGFSDPMQMLEVAMTRVKDAYEDPDVSTCATVRVRIEQQAVLTRYNCHCDVRTVLTMCLPDQDRIHCRA